ncbi:23S ribosomal RNA methyltransferase Erm [Nesterenkonia lacusekhoensis]|uniref:23S rRNA (Adenine-N6)-dimethyltransferase n=1 Tax=Nesterenkonia lacusekhoensis TaxID=150832 RepID=A0ABS4T341_9MICC|nr:23S ribosomal RNA methyltransferase Erm [Nesterenkonia lacusekhoensis]MBP2318869.1 23S rRNA (adenine-N6)-dimethyltransferase [Nesterenkonia lacusekhoensis]
MRTYTDGRHEHGQNFLRDQQTIRRMTDLAARTEGPILEVGPGRGALTFPLEELGRPMTAVEIDQRLAQRLSRHCGGETSIIHGDFLRHRLPETPHTVVGNLPFHLTTAILRRLLHHPHWEQAVLITQWEVARRRAGVGGSSMMTAQWAPYYSFELQGRVPAQAYSPAPAVDGGILTVTRRRDPLLPWKHRSAYAGFVHRLFTGPGRGIGQILQRTHGLTRVQAGRRLGEASIQASALPKHLTAEQWVRLFQRCGADARPARSPKGLSRGR